MLSYEDGNGTLREIFVPSSRYEEAVRLLEKQDWKALSEFSPWSDCPALPPRYPGSMTYTPKGSEGDGKRRTVYLPQGTAERATLLLVNEDWAALENEFEIYSKWSGLLVPSHFKNPIRELRGDHLIVLLH
jgi:hypothetical protein